MNLTLPRAEIAVNAYIRELSREALQLHPPGGGWNRQQVVQHLMLAYDATGREMEKRMAKGTLSKRSRTLKERLTQAAMLRLGYFPPGRKAPDMVSPERSQLPAMDGSSLAAAFHMSVQELSGWIDQAEQRWGSKAAVATHPIIGPLTAEQWRRFHALHALHHARQLERIQGALEAN